MKECDAAFANCLMQHSDRTQYVIESAAWALDPSYFIESQQYAIACV